MRRSGKVIQGVSGFVIAVKGLDLIKLIEGLKHIQEGLTGASEAVQLAKAAHKDMTSLAKYEKGFTTSLKYGLIFDRASAIWH